MIILNLKKINTNSFKTMINKYKNVNNYGFLECPNCKSSNLINWGSYERGCFYIDDNKIIYDILKVKRVKCNDCNKTHALLPSYIIPYKQFLLDVILNCINDSEITYKYNFSIDTILKWKKLFNKYIPYIITTFNIRNCNIIDVMLKNIMYIYKTFYDYNKLILMISHKCIYNMAYF